VVALSVVSIGKDMAFRVVLLASSGARANLGGRVALTVVTGQVRLPLSSRAGLAHRDCPPQERPPSNRFFILAVAFAPVGPSLKEPLCRRWPSCLGMGGKTRQAALVAPPPRLLFGHVTISGPSNRLSGRASRKRPQTSRSLAQQSSRSSVLDTTLQPYEAESSLRPPTAPSRAPLRGRLSLCCHFAFLFLSFWTLRRLAQASPIESVKDNYTSENRKRRSSAFF
jgi:hypothetical protein